MKRGIILLCIFVWTNISAQEFNACDKLIVGDFTCLNCTYQYRNLTSELRKDIIDNLKQPHCTVLFRERLADLLKIRNRERLITSIRELSASEKNTLRQVGSITPERVVFGELFIQPADTSLRVSIVIVDIDSEVQSAAFSIEIPYGKYDTYTKRQLYIQKAINSELLGEKKDIRHQIAHTDTPDITKKLERNNIIDLNFLSLKQPYPYVVLSIGTGLAFLGHINSRNTQKDWMEYISQNPSDIQQKYTSKNNLYKKYQTIRNAGFVVIGTYSLALIFKKKITFAVKGKRTSLNIIYDNSMAGISLIL